MTLASSARVRTMTGTRKPNSATMAAAMSLATVAAFAALVNTTLPLWM